jgi:acetolactate synthase-1/3 small subunit
MMHTFVILVEDKPGVLNRVASLFRRRAFNIESLTVGHTEEPGISRMTIVVDGDHVNTERMTGYLYKLVNVIQVENLTGTPMVSRDLAMIKVRTSGDNRMEVMQMVDVFRARIVDVTNTSLIIEITGDEGKIITLGRFTPVGNYRNGPHGCSGDVAGGECSGIYEWKIIRGGLWLNTYLETLRKK